MTGARELTCRELVELVTEYLEDRLSEADRARFEAHLRLCPDCTEYVEQMRSTLRALGRLPEQRLSPTARADLLQAFRAWHAGD
jgi:anti-sigma factor RsiW